MASFGGGGGNGGVSSRIALRNMSLEDLFWELVNNTKHGSIVRDVVREREKEFVALFQSQMKPKEKNNRPTAKINHPKDIDLDIFNIDDLPQNYLKLGQILLDTGYQGEGLKYDSEDAIDQIRASVHLKQDWDDLIPKAQGFWKAILRASLIWAQKNGAVEK